MKKFFLCFSVLFSAIYGDSQWKQANGPGGTTIMFMEKSTSAIFAANTYLEVFRSIDNGESWSPINITGLNLNRVTTMTSSGHTVFASNGKAIFRSTDDGLSWIKTCDSIPEIGYVTTLEANNNSLFALNTSRGCKIDCGIGGVFRSSDSGVSWIKANDGIDSMDTTTSIAMAGNIIFASGSKNVASNMKHAIYRSLDNGKSWSPSDSGIPDLTSIHRLMVCSSRIIASTNRGLYISNDSGGNWGVFNTSFFHTDTSINSPNYRDTIIMSGDGDKIIACQTKSFSTKYFLSNDNGETWSTLDLNTPLLINDCMVNKSTIFIGSLYRGVYHSTDNGKNLTCASKGINGTTINSLVGNRQSIFASCFGAGVFISTDNGANWFEFNSGLNTLWISSLVIKDNFIYAGSGEYGIFRSPIDSAKWVNISADSLISTIDHLTVCGGKLFASNGLGVYLSNDNGKNWTPVKDAPEGIGAIAAFTVCDSTVFCGGMAGLFYYNPENNTLNKVSSGPANEEISCLVSDSNLIFAGTEAEGCFVSTDKGRNWQKSSLPYKTKNDDFPDGYNKVRVTSLSLCGKVVVASFPAPDRYSPIGGCYFSADSGKSWTPIGPDTTWQTSVAKLLIRGDTILAGSSNQGVWMRTLPKVSEIAIGSSKSGLNPNLQLSLQLSRRASSGLCVTYTLPQPADVSVSIHTLNGSRVASLVNKTQPAGLYNYTWSFGKTTGLYIVRLKTGAQMLSRTIMFTP